MANRIKAFLVSLLVLGAVIGAGVLIYIKWAPEPVKKQVAKKVTQAVNRILATDDYVTLPESVGPTRPSKIVYLNREGGVLEGAPRDESQKNRSSVVFTRSGARKIRFPAFTGSHKTWTKAVSCIRKKFAPFNISIVDARPISGSYIMAMIGGKPADLGGKTKRDKRIAGLAPFTSLPIADAVVMIFARHIRNNVTAICKTAAEEIAHAYGLDHAYNCRDLMTYLKRCGRRSFLNKDLACGEFKKRPCANGDATQNSFKHLQALLGAKTKK